MKKCNHLSLDLIRFNLPWIIGLLDVFSLLIIFLSENDLTSEIQPPKRSLDD